MYIHIYFGKWSYGVKAKMDQHSCSQHLHLRDQLLFLSTKVEG